MKLKGAEIDGVVRAHIHAGARPRGRGLRLLRFTFFRGPASQAWFLEPSSWGVSCSHGLFWGAHVLSDAKESKSLAPSNRNC